MNKEKIAFIPRQYLAVIAVLLAIMMSVLDGTIMNIALPTLAHDFDVTPSTAIWIVNAYQLVITMTLLSFASLGDIYGYRRIFLIGISIFVGASLACNTVQLHTSGHASKEVVEEIIRFVNPREYVAIIHSEQAEIRYRQY